MGGVAIDVQSFQNDMGMGLEHQSISTGAMGKDKTCPHNGRVSILIGDFALYATK